MGKQSRIAGPEHPDQGLPIQRLRNSLVYVVFCDYDPSSSRGLVYLPGKGSPFYYVNMGSIARGGEGNWFIAEKSWEDFIRPVIAKALVQSY
jgi:hypothetical protein